MEYTKATIDDMEEFYDLVQNTIQEVYPKYYPEEVVRFFSQQHCWENLERDLEEELHLYPSGWGVCDWCRQF